MANNYSTTDPDLIEDDTSSKVSQFSSMYSTISSYDEMVDVGEEVDDMYGDGKDDNVLFLSNATDTSVTEFDWNVFYSYFRIGKYNQCDNRQFIKSLI